jgi:hypothetical protein
MATVQITVTVCDYCGDHAQERDETNGGRFEVMVDGFQIEACLHCGMPACQSCLSNRDCCEAEAESKSRARKNGKLFEATHG